LTGIFFQESKIEIGDISAFTETVIRIIADFTKRIAENSK
jgi:hypothetical protein